MQFPALKLTSLSVSFWPNNMQSKLNTVIKVSAKVHQYNDSLWNCTFII